jgi:predicted RNA-binding protein YlqC (UPF0109 family)
MHRFFLLVLSRDFPGGRAYFILPRIGRTYPGPPPEVEGLVKTKGQHTSIFELKVARGDVGKVIGKEGRTAQSMRIILAGASTKLRRRSVLEIVD